MAKELTGTAAGLAAQLEPVLVGALGALNKANDFATKSNIENFADLVQLAVKSHEAGLSMEEFQSLAQMFKMTHFVSTGGSMEFAATVASGVETTEGKQFSVNVTAKGSVAGFGVDAGANYGSDNRKTSFERGQQNIQVRLDWATLPMDAGMQLLDAVAAKVLGREFATPLPGLPVDSQSPTLKAIEAYLPALKALFAPKNP